MISRRSIMTGLAALVSSLSVPASPRRAEGVTPPPAAPATITADGEVTGVTVISPGCGYVNVPLALISREKNDWWQTWEDTIERNKLDE